MNSNNQVIVGSQIFNTTGSTSGSTAAFDSDLTVTGSLIVTETAKIGNATIGSTTITASTTTSLFSLPTFDGANFDYLVKNGANMRAGNIAAVWNGTNVSYNETNTTDLGSTSAITFTVNSTGVFTANISSGTWAIEAMYRALGSS